LDTWPLGNRLFVLTANCLNFKHFGLWLGRSVLFTQQEQINLVAKTSVVERSYNIIADYYCFFGLARQNGIGKISRQ
jgi:hypothetical protein